MTRALVAALVLLLATSCGGDGDDEATPSTSVATTAPSTTTTSVATAPEPASTDLADGRHPGRLTAIDASRRTVTVDIVQFFTGDAAVKAAAEDGGESPPPNDYWIRNQNPRLRTLPATDAVDLTSIVARPYRDLLFWLTLAGGKVVELEEQYLP